MFELPPLKSFCRLVGLIQGMDKKHMVTLGVEQKLQT
jgi:hypothetical protein